MIVNCTFVSLEKDSQEFLLDLRLLVTHLHLLCKLLQQSLRRRLLRLHLLPTLPPFFLSLPLSPHNSLLFAI